MPEMNPLDWLMAGILAFTAARGAFRGLIRELFGVGAVAGGYLLANLLLPTVAPGLEKFFEDKELGTVVTYGLLFFGVMLVLNLIGRIIGRMMDTNAVALVVNRIGGLGFGALKGLLVAAIILFLARPMPAGREMIKDSALVPYLEPAADFLGKQFEDRLPGKARSMLHL